MIITTARCGFRILSREHHDYSVNDLGPKLGRFFAFNNGYSKIDKKALIDVRIQGG